MIACCWWCANRPITRLIISRLNVTNRNCRRKEIAYLSPGRSECEPLSVGAFFAPASMSTNSTLSRSRSFTSFCLTSFGGPADDDLCYVKVKWTHVAERPEAAVVINLEKAVSSPGQTSLRGRRQSTAHRPAFAPVLPVRRNGL